MEEQNKNMFISHASEDKENVVYPLVEAFEKAGRSCWVDKNEIEPGGGIAKRINEGISSSEYVIAVISKHFLGNKWLQEEVWAVRTEEIELEKTKLIIVFVGSKNEREKIFKKYRFLGQKRFISWNGKADEVVNEVMQKIQSTVKKDAVNKNTNRTKETIIVNGVELVLECPENDSKYKCAEWRCTTDDSVMIRIPAGTFWRGSRLGDGGLNEMPKTQVSQNEFFIDKYPITYKKFASFLEKYKKVYGKPYKTTAEKNGGGYECDGKKWNWEKERTWRYWYSEETEDHPVVHVSVEDAQEYCTFFKKSLPTEAQWERAAKGEEKIRYPWGKDDPDPERHAKYFVPSIGLTKTVKVSGEKYQEGQSPFGCFHMAGNVWEWCKDFYDYYPDTSDVLENPEITSKRQIDVKSGKPLYVNRGGSFADNYCNLRCASRSGDTSDAYFHVGFRCVLA